jgi:wyosine [tRNA(Phe)-imidazoG37] synthetase (radical SAM superfamily)
MNYKYLFGPVPSRRLGISLGVDLVKHKTCSLDCIYCECGHTTEHTLERKEYIPLRELFSELSDFLSKKPELDFITFSGSGEPTLHSGIGEVVKFIKKDFPQYKIALLTNSTFLKDKKLQNDIKEIDIIMPSLDAISENVFQNINKPCAGLQSQDILDGLLDFKSIYKGKMFVELFIVPGVNDDDREIELFKEYFLKLKPELIQLNALDRPAAESWVKKASYERLAKIKETFMPLKVEIIAKFDEGARIFFEKENVEGKILAIISRRPCTKADIASVTGYSLQEIENILKRLTEEEKIISMKEERGIFYQIKNHA